MASSVNLARQTICRGRGRDRATLSPVWRAGRPPPGGTPRRGSATPDWTSTGSLPSRTVLVSAGRPLTWSTCSPEPILNDHYRGRK